MARAFQKAETCLGAPMAFPGRDRRYPARQLSIRRSKAQAQTLQHSRGRPDPRWPKKGRPRLGVWDGGKQFNHQG